MRKGLFLTMTCHIYTEKQKSEDKVGMCYLYTYFCLKVYICLEWNHASVMVML